jgi:CubicO group peptidase (beta-lactamase class C family)
MDMKKTLLLLMICIESSFAQDITKQLKEFDAYVEKGRAQWQMPGMAVAVVKDGKVIFKKGYGVRQLGTKNMVDTQTIFGCGSTTKAMTAVCMAILVDEGKVSWDDAVIKHLPEFQLYDPAVTRELKIRDLFIHNSGVGNADFLWSVMNISSEEILRKMQQVEPSYSMRSSFIYQNIFYLAAGKVIEKIAGQKWEDFIQARIFQPLGMKRTFSTLKSIQDPNQSKPHYLVNGSIKVIEPTSADQVGPAGSVYSCVDDISKWAICMLDSSKYEGGRLLKSNTWTELFRPQVIVPASEFYPTMKLTKPNWTTYGLGWFQHDYKGKKINYHTGSLAGEIAIHGQLPDAKLGIYVFGNYDHAELRHALVYKVFDLFALGGNRDWSTEFLMLYTGIKQQGEKAEKDFEAKRVANTNPSKPLADYVGKYSDPLYGEVEITLADKKLLVNVNNFVKATLSHWHYDTFRGDYEKDWYGKAIASFSLDAAGKIEKLNFEGMEFVREKSN